MTESDLIKSTGSMTEDARRQLLDKIELLIEGQGFDELRTLLAESRSSDLAEVMEVVDELARQILFDLLPSREAGEVLEKLDEATRSEVFEELPSQKISEIVGTLPPDEAADMVGELSDERSEEVLHQIGKEESEQIERLLEYGEDTAGGIMSPEYVSVHINDTIAEAVKKLLEMELGEDFIFVYVVDDDGVLQGTVSLRTFLRKTGNMAVRDVMKPPISIPVAADQEEVAQIFRKNDLWSAAVVDENGVLVGRITVDDVVDVMEEEAEEDALVMAGTHPDELDTRGYVRAATIRLPWLMACMAGAMCSAFVLFSAFEPQFPAEQWAAIVMFVPAIAAIGGNSGLQTSTVVLRGLATGDLVALSYGQVFARESRIAVIVAVICGILASLCSWAWLFISQNFSVSTEALAHGDLLRLGSSVGLAMFGGILLSTTLGLSLPFMFRRLGIDPAISSGPLVTTANDALGILTYFTLSLLFLRIL